MHPAACVHLTTPNPGTYTHARHNDAPRAGGGVRSRKHLLEEEAAAHRARRLDACNMKRWVAHSERAAPYSRVKFGAGKPAQPVLMAAAAGLWDWPVWTRGNDRMSSVVSGHAAACVGSQLRKTAPSQVVTNPVI